MKASHYDKFSLINWDIRNHYMETVWNKFDNVQGQTSLISHLKKIINNP